MTEIEKTTIDAFDTVALVVLDPKETSLPIDTAVEWNKGFRLINMLIKELTDLRYIEEFEDASGHMRERLIMHPQLLGYMQERRKTIDQIFKLSGGEIDNEIKKAGAKKLADFLFQMQTDKIKEKYKKEAYEIIECEVSEDASTKVQSQ